VAEAYACQRCGAAMGPESAQGLCPACLLQEGLRDSQVATLPSGAPGNSAAELAELGRLFPQLEVLELVGRGGMGVVYKARQRGLDRLVALKILPPQVDHDPGFRERFAREARALARLTHPNIVAVYDFGQVEGRYYFLMEFVDGANLRKMLQGGHLKSQDALAIVPQLCDALQFAHEEGIVHRDIKPENILLDRKGRVKIADFGLAKLLGASVQQDPYTLTGPRQVLGTPHYMAPEQFERPGTVDHRADIYSMGVVFYEMLTGELPLGRFPMPSRKVQIDVRLDEVVLRTLEKEPEHRYQHAVQVKTELQSLTALPSDGGPPTWSAGNAGWARGENAMPVGGPARVSPYAILGFLSVFPFPLGMIVVIALIAGLGPPPNDAAVGLTVIMAVLALVSAVLSYAFGVAGIRQIRRSAGHYYGLKLALADVVLYPLLLLDAIMYVGTMVVFQPMSADADRFSVMVCLAAAIGADVLLVRHAWRVVMRRMTTRPDRPPFVPPAARPAHPPSHYELPPRRKLGCLPILGIGLALVLGTVAILIAVARIYEGRMAQFDARSASVALGQGTVRADVSSDYGTSGDTHSYRFEFRSPVDMKTTVWAEIWHNGKLETNPGFAVTQWVIPPPMRAFDGVVTFKLGPPVGSGQIKAGWQISGNTGAKISEESIEDPFAGMSLRDSTWGVLTGSWSVPPGRPIQILALRGAKRQLNGSADDETAIGQADGEIRIFARFDTLTVQNKNPRTMFGESSTTPSRGSPVLRQPLIPPQPSVPAPDAEPPPAIRGSAAEGRR